MGKRQRAEGRRQMGKRQKTEGRRQMGKERAGARLFQPFDPF
jgi:hypothetical protein